jgi:O-antigen/teichoic acid export membrane protein
MFGTLFSQIFLLATLPVISRLYSVEEYAQWALLLAASGIVTVVISLRYELYIVQAKSTDEISQIVKSIIGIALLLSFLVFLVFLIPIVNSFFFGSIAHNRLLFVFLAISLALFFCLLSVINQVLVWHERYSHISYVNMSVPVVTSVLQILFAVNGEGSALTLAFAAIIGQLTGIIVGLVRNPLLGVLRIPFKKHLAFEILSANKEFPMYSVPYMLAGSIKDRVSLLLISNFVGNLGVGAFFWSYKLLYTPVSLVSVGLRPVIYKSACSGDKDTLESQISILLETILFMALPVAIVFSVISKELFSFVFGAKWAEAGVLSQFLVWPMLILMLCNWMDRLFDYKKKQRTALILELGSSILILGYLVLAFRVGCELPLVTAGFSFLLLLYHLFYLRCVSVILGVKIKFINLSRVAFLVGSVVASVMLTLVMILPWYAAAGVTLLLAALFLVPRVAKNMRGVYEV